MNERITQEEIEHHGEELARRLSPDMVSDMITYYRGLDVLTACQLDDLYVHEHARLIHRSAGLDAATAVTYLTPW